MEYTLPIEAALELIAFIAKTNYRLAPSGDGCFDSADEAIEYVQSDEYDPDEPLDVCFRCKGVADYMESATACFDGSNWLIVDFSLGGLSACGSTIEDALRDYQQAHGEDDRYAPEDLLINEGV